MIFQTVAKKQQGNLITSPLSVNFVLTMAAFGAKENTRKQMQDVLQLPADDGLTKTGSRKLIDSLNVNNNIFFKHIKIINFQEY